MTIEALDKVKFLFSKVTGAHKENNSFREQAHLELLEILKGIIDNDDKRKEMFNWLKSHQEKDKKFISFIKQEIFKISATTIENPQSKEELLTCLDKAVKAENEGDFDSEYYEDLAESVEGFVDAGEFHILNKIMEELLENIDYMSAEESAIFVQKADMLSEVIFYVTGNIYRSDVQDNKDIIKSSTIYLMPILMRAKNSIVETPKINDLSAAVKDTLLNRGIIDNVDDIEVGTSLYNIKNIEELSFEDFWILHNSILFDYDTGPDNELRETIQQYNGEASLVCAFITVHTSLEVADPEGIKKKVELLEKIEKSFSDRQIWSSIGDRLESVHTKCIVYSPEDMKEFVGKIDFYKQLTNIRVILSRPNNYDIIYSNLKNSTDFLVMFVDKDTGLTGWGCLLKSGEDPEGTLLELSKICEDENINLYKYKKEIGVDEFTTLSNGFSGEAIDAFKYIKNSIPVDDEWKSWLTINKIPSKMTLH